MTAVLVAYLAATLLVLAIMATGHWPTLRFRLRRPPGWLVAWWVFRNHRRHR